MNTPCTIYFVEAEINGTWQPLLFDGDGGPEHVAPSVKFSAFTDKKEAAQSLTRAEEWKPTLGAASVRLSRRVARGSDR